MSIAMTRRKIELDNGASDLTKALTVAGAIAGGVAGSGNPAAISAGAGLGQTIGGVSDGQQQKDRLEAAQKPIAGAPPPIIEQKQDDFTKVMGVLQAGGNAAGALGGSGQSAPSNEAPLPGGQQGAYMDGSSSPAMMRRMNRIGRTV